MNDDFTFEIDEDSLRGVENLLRQAAELPRKKLTSAVKKGMKIPLNKAKFLLRKVPSDYKMTFDDGNTWTKEDIIKNLYLKLEKGGGKSKKVYRLGIRDWRIDKYSNFVEFGYHDKYDNYKWHKATHFMRDSLTDEASLKMLEELAKSLDEVIK